MWGRISGILSSVAQDNVQAHDAICIRSKRYFMGAVPNWRRHVDLDWRRHVDLAGLHGILGFFGRKHVG
jgi:hypothetical protein